MSSVLSHCVLYTLAYSMAFTVAVANSPETIADLKLPVTQLMADQWVASGSARMTQSQMILNQEKNNGDSVQQGSIWSRLPFPYQDAWEIIMKFKVSGNGSTPAEGMALWLSETPNKLGHVFGSQDYFKGLALVFDTKDNDGLRNNPSISAHFMDGKSKYNHDDDGLSTQIAGCIADFQKRDNAIAVKMTYKNGKLGVYVDLPGNGVFRRCLEKDVALTRSGPWFVGVSAETVIAEKQDIHEVISLEMSGDRIFEPSSQTPASQSQTSAAQASSAAQIAAQNAAAAQAAAAMSQKVQQNPVTPPTEGVNTASDQNPAQQAYWNQWAAMNAGDEIPLPSGIHEKIDQLMSAAQDSASQSNLIGEALAEIKDNVLKHISNTAKALYSHMSNLKMANKMLEKKIDDQSTLIIETNGSIKQGRIDTELRISELVKELKEVKNEISSIKVAVDKASRNALSHIDRRLSGSAPNGNSGFTTTDSSGDSRFSIWLYVGLFQATFVTVLVWRGIVNRQQSKRGKLL